MANNNFFGNNPFADAIASWNEAATKAMNNNPFANAKVSAPFDVNAISESQRKTIAAFTQAGQKIAESSRESVESLAKIAQQNVNETLHALKDAISAGSPEASATRQAELAKELIETNLAKTGEIFQRSSRVTQDVFKALNERAAEFVSEMNDVTANTSSPKKKSKAA
ncbi:MAG: hypothetical protein K0R63_1564 [Rickettsiales bacterium]|jgi:phasin family protein|nr:hypothetical protein [Rickettsiales bacterium]